MYEIHHFFTPLLDHFDDFDNNDWFLHPVITLENAKNYRDYAHFTKNVETLNAVYDRLQKIATDYLTLNLFGRKTGRKFIQKIQEKLTLSDLLSYNNQVRQTILSEMNIKTADFISHRSFVKHELQHTLHEFYENNGQKTPTAMIYTDDEVLMLENCSHHIVQNYLHRIEKTA